MSTHAAIDTAIVYTRDMPRLADFYRQGLGLGKPQASPGHLGFQVGAVYFGFDQVEKDWASPAAVTLWFRVDDLQTVFERFIQLGARVNYAPVVKSWGDLLASVFDLDGNLVGLSQRREEA
jgi:uncharacterized glyoxalase superfamily protein PhnB